MFDWIFNSLVCAWEILNKKTSQLSASLNGFEKLSLSLLKISVFIIVTLFIVFYAFNVISWLYYKDEGIVIQPVEMGGIEGNLSGKAVADLLSYDLQNIKAINLQEQQNPTIYITKESNDNSNNISKINRISYVPSYAHKNYLESRFAQISSIGVEQTSVPIGPILLSMKDFRGDRLCNIACSLHRYESTIRMIGIVEDHSYPEKEIKFYEANRNTINQSLDSLIADMTDEIAYKIILGMCENSIKVPERNLLSYFMDYVRISNISGSPNKAYIPSTVYNEQDFPQSWKTLKYLTEEKENYTNYLSTKNVSYLNNSMDMAFKAMKSEPDFYESADLLCQIGLAYLDRGFNMHAISIFNRTYRSKPLQSTIGLGLAYNNISRYEDAINAFEVATKLEPNSTDAWFNEGIAYSRLLHKDNEAVSKAILCFNASIAPLNNSTVQSRKKIAQALAEEGAVLAANSSNDMTNVISFFDRAINLDSLCSLAWRDKAYVLATKNHDWDKSISCLDKAISLDPNYAWTWYFEGYVHNQKNEGREALIDLDRAIKLNRNYALAWYEKSLAYCRSKYKDKQSARDSYDYYSNLCKAQNITCLPQPPELVALLSKSSGLR